MFTHLITTGRLTGASRKSVANGVWSNYSIPLGAYGGVAYNGVCHLAVTLFSNGCVITYNNGASWVAKTNLPYNNATAICAVGTRFVAAQNYGGTNQFAYTDNEAASWTAVPTPTSGNYIDIASDGVSTLIAVADNLATYALSTNSGASWTSHALPFTGATSVQFGNGQFLILGTATTSTAAVVNVGTPTVATAITLPAAQPWARGAYGNGTWVLVAGSQSTTTAASTAIAAGSNLASLTYYPTALANANWQDIAFSNGEFHAISVFSTAVPAYRTTNPAGVWSTAAMGTGANWFAISPGNNAFVAVGNTASYADTTVSNSYGLTPVSSSASVSANQTELQDAQAATVAARASLQAAQTELQDGQTATTAAIAGIQATQTEQQDAQSATIAGVASAQAAQSEAQDGQTATIASGAVAASVSAAQTEIQDGQSAQAAVIGQVQATQTELADSQTATAAGIASVNASQTEIQDTQAATLTGGAVSANVSAAQTEIQDAQAAQVAAIARAQAAQTELQDTQTALLDSGNAVVSTLGFGMSGRVVRAKSLLQQIKEARAERARPATTNARKKAQAIEVQAAFVAMETGNEGQFKALMQKWLAQKPVIPQAAQVDPYALFMAQVQLQIQAIEAQRAADEQDDEDAIYALLH